MTYAQRKARKEMKNIALITAGLLFGGGSLVAFALAAGSLIAGA